MKKTILLSTMFFIVFLSNIPNLIVIDPLTWTNPPEFEKHIRNFYFLFNLESSFYNPYSNIKNINFFFHKMSHAFFYGVLAWCFWINIKDKNNIKNYLVSFGFVFIFAFLDEVHQYFVVGRSGRMMDVFLDSFSGLTVLAILFSYSIVKRKKIKKKLLKTIY